MKKLFFHTSPRSTTSSNPGDMPPPPPPPPPPPNPPPASKSKRRARFAQSSPTEYHNAISKFHETVHPNLANDDGRSFVGGGGGVISSNFQTYGMRHYYTQHEDVLPMAVSSPRRRTQRHPSPLMENSGVENVLDDTMGAVSVVAYSETAESAVSMATTKVSSLRQKPSIDEEANHVARGQSSSREPEMPDATYEENYGDAYVGAPIRYVYPSGYQNMRPRSGPWKLSLVVFGLFTWLSIFIVGHCSDRIDTSKYNVSEIDDDTLKIETRWCGSRILHMMWVVSVIITALAAAYCSIIGYIKVRDFVVANGRSQPPGMVGKSDYYVRIEEGGTPPPPPPKADGKGGNYQSTIYQADGTPQFWGGHIYRPTQAAVAVTSR